MDFSTFKNQYENGDIQITEDISYSVRDVIKRSIRLKHGQFEEPNFPDGSAKLFYRIGMAICSDIARNSDLDTKDIESTSMNGLGVKILPLLKMGVQWYLKVTKFGTFMNDFKQELVEIGHVVVKVVNNKPKIVNPLNLIIPPHAESIQDSGLIEATFLTYEDMLKYKKDFKKKWDKIEELYEAMKKSGEIYFTVYEYWTYAKFDGKYQRGCIKYLDGSMMPTTQAKDPSSWEIHEELDRFAAPDKFTDPLTGKEMTGYPYVDRGLIKLRGRYWRMGVYEVLAGLIEDYNERMNLKRRLDRQALTGVIMHVLPSQIANAKTLTNQFLNYVDQGAILDVQQDERLERLDTQVIPDFLPMIDKLFELMRILLGVTAQGVGEELPSGTPATLGVINRQVAQTTYDAVIEEQSLFYEELFTNFLGKYIVSQICSKKVVPITGEVSALEDLDNYFAEHYLNQHIADFEANHGRPGVMKDGEPVYFSAYDEAAYKDEYNKELNAMLDKLKELGSSRYVEYSKEMVKDMEYAIRFYSNNESFDKRAVTQDIMQLRQIPDMTLSKKKLDEYLLSLASGDLDAKRFQKSKEEKAEELQALRDKSLAEMGGMTANMPVPEQESTQVTPGQQFIANNAQ